MLNRIRISFLFFIFSTFLLTLSNCVAWPAIPVLYLLTGGEADGGGILIPPLESCSAPSVQSVSAVDNTTVQVAFSGSLDQASSQTTANYIITGLNVFSASTSGTTVTLTTSSQTATSYPVTVNGVSSGCGSSMSAYSGSFTGLSPASSDTTAPTLDSVTVESNSSILLTFSEAVSESTAETVANYCIETTATASSDCSGTTLAHSNPVRLPANNAQVRLTTATQSAISYTVTVSNVEDLAAHPISAGNTQAFNGDARPEVCDGTSNCTPNPAEAPASNDTTHVTVTFSEDVDATTAGTPTNYIIENQSTHATLTVSTAVRRASPNANQVILTTATQSPSTTYEIRVIGVQDLTGNIVVSNSNTFDVAASPPGDTTDPELISAESIAVNKVRVTFSESVDSTTAESTGNYCLETTATASTDCSGTTLAMSEATRNPSNPAQVDLTLAAETNGEGLTVTVNNVQDLNARTIAADSQTAFTADARPTVTLAAATGSTSVRVTFSEEVTTASSECSSAGACSAIYSISGGIIVYSATRISPTLVDLVTGDQSNTTYTLTVAIGTVADTNSNTIQSGNTYDFTGSASDITPPALLGATALTSTTIELTFSEAVTTASAQDTGNYVLNPSVAISTAVVQANPSKVVLTTGTALTDFTTYALTVTDIKDNKLNTLYPNPSTSSFYVDFSALVIDSVYEYDCDFDGNIDEVVLVFSKAMNDSSIADSDAARFTLGGTTFIKVDSGSGGSGAPTPTCSNGTGGQQDPGDPNDNKITLFTNDVTVTGTDVRELNYTAAPNRLQDQNGNDLVSVANGDVAETDLAAPVITKASTESGTDLLKVLFSEAVYPQASCGSGTLIAGDINYNDNGTTNVTGWSTITDNDGSDGQIILQGNGSFNNTDDMFLDTVNAVSNSICDSAGNVTNTAQRLITGIVRPYVKTAVSLSANAIRVTFSEGVDNTLATTNSKYCVTTSAPLTPVLISGDISVACGGSSALTINNISKIDDSTYDIVTTTDQIQGNTYYLTVSACAGTTASCSAYTGIVDLNEGAYVTSPYFGSFVGQEKLKVVSAEATGLNTFVITFSRNVNPTGINGADQISYYTIPAVLGTVTSAVASGNTVTVTHTGNQGVGVYSVVVSTDLKDSTNCGSLLVCGLQANPLDRSTFIGFGGSVETLDDGAIFDDPFSDGSSFAFAFAYKGQVYMGPNDANSGVFRFDPDGANATTITFDINSGAYTSFGANMIRPAPDVSTSGGNNVRYTFPAGVDLTPYATGNSIEVTGCTNAANNATTTVTAIDVANNYLEATLAAPPVPASGETCIVFIRNASGPDGWVGVNAFVSGTVSGREFLAFGGYKFQGITKAYVTEDNDNLLDISECDLADITIGNTKSLQMIYGYGSKMYVGFASDGTKAPLFGTFDPSVLPAACNNEADLGTGSNEFHYVDDIGTSGDNPTTFPVTLDSMIVYGGNMYVATYGGIARTPTIPPTSATDFDNEGAVGTVLICNATGTGGTCATTWIGTEPAKAKGYTQKIPNIGKLRPGELGIPAMIEWNGNLFVARNSHGVSSESLAGTVSLPGGSTTRYTFSAATDLSGVSIGNKVQISGCKYAANNKVTTIAAVNDGSDYVDVDDGAVGFAASNETCLVQIDPQAELWKYNGSSWTVLLRSSDTDANNLDISIVIDNGDYLYVAFDNEITGAEVWRTNVANPTLPSDFEKLGQDGMGPISTSASDRAKNKHVMSAASILNQADGKYYLYFSVGCVGDFRDNGSCDRDGTSGTVDFSFKVFRQID